MDSAMQIKPIEPAARENLIRLAQSHCKATGNTLMTLGRYAHGDPPFFKDLIARHAKWERLGRPDRVDADRKGSFTFRVYDKVLAWFYNLGNWPEGTTFADFPPLNKIHQTNEDQHGTTEIHGTEEAPQAARPEQAEGRESPAAGSRTLDRLRKARVQETTG